MSTETSAIEALHEILSFDPYEGLSEAEVAQRAADRQREIDEFKAVEVALEEAFPELGLRFTQGFKGAIPVQAYGWILGQRFYFRFRGDIASLNLGTVDREKAVAAAENRIKFLAGTDEPSAEQREDIMERFNIVVKSDLSVDAFPTEVSQRVVIGGYTGDVWNGVLTPAQAQDVFAKLVEKLEK